MEFFFLMKKSITCEENYFSNFSIRFLNPKNFSNLNFNCSNFLDLRKLQEQAKKAFCYQKFFWPFTVWMNCSNDLKHFANSRPTACNFKTFSWSLEQFFLTVGQNNFGNKIPFSLPFFHFPFSFFPGYGGELPRLDDECIKTVIDSRKYLFYTTLFPTIVIKNLWESLESL